MKPIQSGKRAGSIILVLDANIWIKERLLKSKLGAVLLYTVMRISGKIALSWVTEEESIMGIVKEAEKSATAIKENLVTIRVLMGRSPDVPLPTQEEIAKKAKERFEELAKLIYRVDPSFEQTKSSLKRVIAGLAPNRKKEQFRDSLLWEMAIELSRSHDVHFITQDSDFYEDYNTGELATELKKEVAETGGTLSIYKNLETFMEKFAKYVPPLDYHRIAVTLDDTIKQDLLEYGENKLFTLGKLQDHKIVAFLTEKKEFLALKFHLKYEITNAPRLDNIILPNAVLVVRGNCFFNIESGLISEIELDSIEGEAPNGEMIPNLTTSYSRGNVVIGLRKIPYRLRKELQ